MFSRKILRINREDQLKINEKQLAKKWAVIGKYNEEPFSYSQPSAIPHPKARIIHVKDADQGMSGYKNKR